MHLDKKVYNVDTYKNVGVKIVQISDIHFSNGYNMKILESLLCDIDVINPDYVCIVGDLIDEYNVVCTSDIEFFKKWLKRLSSKYKVIVSLGNHDFIVKQGKKYVENCDIKWLLEIKSDKFIILNNDVYCDNGINFIGFNPSFKYYSFKERYFFDNNFELSSLLSNLSGFNILMLHTPIMLTFNNNYMHIENFDLIDLVLSGHTHGGLMPSWFFGNFGIVSPYLKLFPKCVRGRVSCGKCDMIISSGVVKLSKKSRINVLNDLFGYNINVINIKKI